MAKPPSKPRAAGLLNDAAAPLRGRPRTLRDPLQPQLPFDPMPDRIEPCLALLVPKPPTGSEWAFEVKWDGYRVGLHRDARGVRIITRGGHDWTHRFPAIETAAKALDVGNVILDGEAVVLDGQGRSDFGALQQALGGRGGKRSAGEAILYAFDLLYFDGHDLTGMHLDERRTILESLLSDDNGVIRLSEEVQADGADLLRSACEHGLEGIIAKHRDKPYRSGRQGDWLKIKCVQSESFVVVGYEPSKTMPGAIANLLLGARKNGELVCVGSVGTGFKDQVARDLRVELDALKTATPSIVLKRKNVVFSIPTLIAEIEFRAWTGDGKLRHASFKGLREAADHSAIYEIE